MRILAAPDKFRGTATAAEVASAVAGGGGSGGRERRDEAPMSESGEGATEVLGGT
ncbi:MAG: glycerate kinase, partial [Acidimicrobiales bacterium]